ncbi:hypothetical protein ACFY2Z_41060 [Streptomyces sp. NPDC001222]|uniref:hypothetical protein n=1 Tax=Streptomyces sp. NPDC001222 TaxID=3364548 RepID=UPI0036736519
MNLTLGISALIFGICILFSALVSTGAGCLHHSPGARKRDSLLYAGKVFVKVMTLCMVVLGALVALSGMTT